MKKILNNCVLSLAVGGVFLLAPSTYGQNEKSKTQTDVIGLASVTTTDVARVSNPGATDVKSESTPKPTFPAPSQPSNGADEWHFEIRPYLWLAGIYGNLRVGNTTGDTTQSSSDVLGMLDFAAAAQVEAIRGDWRLMIDENYVNLGVQGTGPLGLVTVDVQPTMNIFEIGGSYRAVAVPNKKATDDDPMPPVFSAEILGGLRWVHMGLALQAGNNPGVEGSRNLIGPFIGNRFKASPNKALTFIGKYTIGGSGSGSGFAWSGEGLIDLRLKKSFSLAGGYRALGLRANQPSNTIGFDGTLRGLVLYMTIYR